MRVEGGSRSASDAIAATPPLVSIISVVFQDRAEVEALIDNIAEFRSADLEFLVIDGGSDDGTPDLLQRRSASIDHWISEPDTGIYDAMNKGVQAARGTYLLHVNAGDRLRLIPWDKLRQCASEAVDVVCCRVLMDGVQEFVSRTGLLSRIDNTWHHQGTFYRRDAHRGYDPTYRICGDFEHNQRLLRAACTQREFPDVVCEHRNDGVSLGEDARGEIYRSVRQHFGRFYLALSALRFALAPAWLWVKRRLRPGRLRAVGAVR